MTNFPGWEERQLRVPDGFVFDEEKLKHTEGLVDFTTTPTTRQRDLDEWLRVARAELGQSGVDILLSRLYQDNFQEKNLPSNWLGEASRASLLRSSVG